jgi:serine/threonine protein phosphatase PrpC
MQVHTAFAAAGATDRGLVRDANEDRFHVDPARGFFLVIDGVGGQAAGEKAAETALGLVRTRLERETGSVEDRVREAIGLANDEIYRRASLTPEWKGMACVLTVAVVSNGDVVVGHVGDTRLYKLRGGRIDKLTRDHSPVGEREDAGDLTEREAMQHRRRNEVYRDVGSEPHDPDEPGFIDVGRHPFEPDAAILLCSDGLSDMVSSEEIAGIVRAGAGHPQRVVRDLIAAANDAGGRDNVTVVYVEGAAFAVAPLARDEPRLAIGEETRDLRARRDRGASDTSSAARGPAVAPRSRAARWRLASLVTLLVIVSATALYTQRDRFVVPATIAPGVSGSIVVRPGESVAAAVRRATPGSDVTVEPGEYRERLELASGVRVISRVPRGATLRLPGGSPETDPAVVAFEVTGAALSGFRILGDAATPLGSGVLVRNSTVTLSDLEIAGARGAGVEYRGGSGGSIVGGYFHDNAVAAIAVGSGASPRIAHNAFVRNAGSERAAGTIVVESDAHPIITANTFVNFKPDAAVVPPRADLGELASGNWFIPPQAPTAPPGRGGRGRQ